MLYIVPTPIGNLQDITFKAVEVLKKADIILAEDTRTSKKLLNHYGIETPLRSYHAHNEHATLNSWIDRLLEGETIALMGSTGRSTGPHVHFEVWRNGRAVDPSKYIQAH